METITIEQFLIEYDIKINHKYIIYSDYYCILLVRNRFDHSKIWALIKNDGWMGCYNRSDDDLFFIEYLKKIFKHKVRKNKLKYIINECK